MCMARTATRTDNNDDTHGMYRDMYDMNGSMHDSHDNTYNSHDGHDNDDDTYGGRIQQPQQRWRVQHN
ncbi:hypothetical protein CVT25_012055 [Psilocybe cyanescens]|uniref:Uncharacterized protein n=1 Tax=Psilocybe cyanescens TaxID=93625 RepID=A0A409X7R2_PSICY|nr:hypothetical protein CVT25_012055 [Psilocybe cyanescens]